MYLVDQSKLCEQIYLQKIACCINLQLPILFFVKSIISGMYHRITLMYINFQQYWVSRSVKPVTTKIFAKDYKLHKFAIIPIIYIFFNSITLDMHHHKAYMYINFQQNRVCRSVKTVHTNLFAKIRKLHKFATTNSNF